MNWQDIKVSSDQTHFLLKGKVIFNRKFEKVMNFHAPGLAPVKDKTGSYHIDVSGNQLYTEKYEQTFGFYCNRAAVMYSGKWFHLDEEGNRVYPDDYAWTGNYQEDLCTVRDLCNHFFHIVKNGKRAYAANYLYCGDYKDGFACVRQSNRLYRHIDIEGRFIYHMEFLDLGVFHKGYATARDGNGWYHITNEGKELYAQRFKTAEPFYNGFSLVTQFDDSSLIIDETGKKVLYL
jgi:hypothetical protein